MAGWLAGCCMESWRAGEREREGKKSNLLGTSNEMTLNNARRAKSSVDETTTRQAWKSSGNFVDYQIDEGRKKKKRGFLLA